MHKYLCYCRGAPVRELCDVKVYRRWLLAKGVRFVGEQRMQIDLARLEQIQRLMAVLFH